MKTRQILLYFCLIPVNAKQTDGQGAYSFPCAAECSFQRLLTPPWTMLAFLRFQKFTLSARAGQSQTPAQAEVPRLNGKP